MKLTVVVLFAAAVLWGLYAVGSLVYGQIAKKRSLQRLPEVARNLGLSVDERGLIEGEFRGRRVRVVPEGAMVLVPLSDAPDLFLTTRRRQGGRTPDLPPFESGDRSFDGTFPVRRAAPGVAERLAHDAALRERLVALANGRPRVASLTIRPSSGLSLRLGAGGPWIRHIPPARLEGLLSEAVGLADALEQRLR